MNRRTVVSTADRPLRFASYSACDAKRRAPVQADAAGVGQGVAVLVAVESLNRPDNVYDVAHGALTQALSSLTFLVSIANQAVDVGRKHA